MKKKLIALILIFIFSFTMISTTTQKQTNAIAIVGGYSIVQVIGMLLGGVTLIGGGAVVGDLVNNPDDNHEFTDWLKNEYVDYMRNYQQLPGQPPPPEHELSNVELGVLLGMLAEQGITVTKDIYSIVKNYFNSSNSDLPGENDNVSAPFYIYPNSFGFYTWPLTNYANYDNGVYTIYPQNIGNYQKYVFLGGDVLNYVFLHFGNYGTTTRNGITYPNIKIITPNGNALIVPPDGAINKNDMNYYNSQRTVMYELNYSNDLPPLIDTNIPDIVIPPTDFIEDDDFQTYFKGLDLSPLSGLVSSNQEMIDIVTGAKQVPPAKYEQIKTAWNQVLENYLANPNLIGSPAAPKPPTINPNTGLVDYNNLPSEPQTDPDNQPDELSALNKGLYWLKSIWYGIRDLPGNIANSISNAFNWLKNWINQFWTNINTLVDDFWMTFSTWWQDNFIVHWTAFVDWIQSMPNLIADAFTPLLDNLMIPINALLSILQNIWDWLQDFPDLLIGLIVPPDNAIAEVWQPFILIWAEKIEPIQQPLKNLSFHETELQDITANLKLNGTTKTYKIIDYQYLKFVRDQVQNIIRAFFWILILFFNLDQLHRLIRNQGLIRSYVRKVDEPGGKK